MALYFFKNRENLYYWKSTNEVDFIIDNTAINVVASKTIPTREFLGLEEIRKEHKLITDFKIISETTTNKTIALSEFLLS